MNDLTSFQQEIKSIFFRYIQLIPPELIEVKSYIETSNNNSLVLSMEPTTGVRSHLYIMIEDNGATQIEIASHATFERFHPSVKGGGPKDVEYIERLIRAVICGRIEEISVLKNGEIIRSDIHVYSESGEKITGENWSNSLGLFARFLRDTEKKIIKYEPYLSSSDYKL